MPPVATDALVLHVFDYLETSRIVRLATRDFGVLSVLARGVRRSSSRFGSALDLFAEGAARIDLKPGRDLQTLNGFDVTTARPELALDLSRFTAASALSECVMRMVSEDHAPEAFDVVREAMDALAHSAPEQTVSTALASLWHLVATLGFAPALDGCALCHRAIDPEEALAFSHVAGGVLCAACAARGAGARRLPEAAHRALAAWTVGDSGPGLSVSEGRAHQRLLREFVGQHLPDARQMKAWAVWEQGNWG